MNRWSGAEALPFHLTGEHFQIDAWPIILKQECNRNFAFINMKSLKINAEQRNRAHKKEINPGLNYIKQSVRITTRNSRRQDLRNVLNRKGWRT